MKIQSVNHNNIYFKAHSGMYTADSVSYPGVQEARNTKTAFARNYPTLEFTRDYIHKTFPDGAKIAEFGCSKGQKAYSLMMMLDKYNADKRYKITGYDCQMAADMANQGVYYIQADHKDENRLFDKNTDIGKAFTKYFIKDINARSSYDFLVTPNKEVTADIVKFQEGNILNIKNILVPKKNNVIIFQNALYHILKNDNYGYPNAQKLFNDIASLLPDDGIFVIGSLPSDHLNTLEYSAATSLKYQNGERIKVLESSLIHDYLKNAGFEPIFYEQPETSVKQVIGSDVYLPSVWKKTK